MSEHLAWLEARYPYIRCERDPDGWMVYVYENADQWEHGSEASNGGADTLEGALAFMVETVRRDDAFSAWVESGGGGTANEMRRWHADYAARREGDSP